MVTICVVKFLQVECLVRVTIANDVDLVGVEAKMCRPRVILTVCMIFNVNWKRSRAPM